MGKAEKIWVLDSLTEELTGKSIVRSYTRHGVPSEKVMYRQVLDL